MNKVPKTDYPMIAEMYNRDGRDAAYAYISDHYGIHYPDRIVSKIRKEPGFTYDERKRMFTETGSAEVDRLFMSLDELCSPIIATHASGSGTDPSASSKDAMDRLIRTLISDRLLELSRYVSLDTMTRTIIVDRSSMAADGYKVLIH